VGRSKYNNELLDRLSYPLLYYLMNIKPALQRNSILDQNDNC